MKIGHLISKYIPFRKALPSSDAVNEIDSVSSSDIIVHEFVNGAWNDDIRTSEDVLPENSRGGKITWLEVKKTQKETVQKISEAYEIDSFIKDDMLYTHLRPKITIQEDSKFISLRVFYILGGVIKSEQVSIFIKDNLLITMQESELNLFPKVKKSLINYKKSKAPIIGLLNYLLIDSINNRYLPVLETLSDDFNEIEHNIVNNTHKSYIIQLQDIKKSISMIMMSIWAHYEIMAVEIKECGKYNSSKMARYYKDCQDQVLQIFHYLKDTKEDCVDLINLFLGLQNSRTNEIMKFLTIVSSVFLPCSFIASLYGMNFDRSVSVFNMPELGWKYGYFFALGMMFLSSSTILLILLYKKWIRFSKDT